MNLGKQNCNGALLLKSKRRLFASIRTAFAVAFAALAPVAARAAGPVAELYPSHLTVLADFDDGTVLFLIRLLEPFPADLAYDPGCTHFNVRSDIGPRFRDWKVGEWHLVAATWRPDGFALSYDGCPFKFVESTEPLGPGVGSISFDTLTSGGGKTLKAEAPARWTTARCSTSRCPTDRSRLSGMNTRRG